MTRVFGVLVLGACVATALHAQPADDATDQPAEPPAETPAETTDETTVDQSAGETADPPADSSVAGSMEVAAQLWAVIGRYRFAATADRVRVTLVRPGGRSDMHSMEIRCVPGTTGLARLEIGDLTLEARAGRLRAVHRRDPTTFYSTEIPTDAEGEPLRTDPATVLRALLPMFPIPHLSLAFDEAEVGWCPLVTGLVWERAERLEDGGMDGVRLVGKTDSGRASLEMSGARVRRFEAELDPTGQTRVIVECEPLAPSDPDGWVLDVTGRREVSSLAALRPLGPVLTLGDPMPRIELHSIGSSPAPVLPSAEDSAVGLSKTFHPVLFFRDSTPPAFVRDAVGKVAAALETTSRDVLRGRLDGLYDKRLRLMGLAGAVEVTTDDEVFTRLDAKAAAWREGFVDSGQDVPAGPGLGWFVTDARLVDRVALTAEAAVVMLDGAGRIRTIVPINAESTAEDLGAVLLSSVTGSL